MAIFARDLTPDLIGEPLEALARVGELIRWQGGGVIREMAGKLDHLVEELAQNHIPASFARRVRH